MRAAFGAPNGQFLVGAVGNIRPAKSYDTLLRAAALLAARAPDYRFVIAGDADSPLGERMRALAAKLGLGDIVTFAGFIADVPAVMASVDVYALTSSSEGFSIATTEAMAAGKPIVATRCGGPEEILEDGVTGLLVENGSAEAVASAIESLRVDATKRETLGKRAREEVARRFNLAAHIGAYERLYDECVAARRSSPPAPPVVG
jgi:glycosyltransferase involved in cell wall biosynthesis